MENLTFLYNASNDDIRILCDLITLDKKGNSRLTENLTNTDAYKQNYPHNMRALVPEIIAELRLFGGNTFVNLFRGEGPEYPTILRDVARKQKVNFNKKCSDETIERYILQKIFDDLSQTMTNEQLKVMIEQMDIHLTHFDRQVAIAAIQAAIRMGGFQSYIWLVTVANAIVKFLLGRGLSFAANAALTRVTAILVGPIGWALTALWTAIDIAGPAYRITIPAVIQIAYMRQKAQFGNIVNLSQ